MEVFGMNKSTFTKLVDSGSSPPEGLSGPLLALCLGRRGDWEASHALVNEMDTSLGSWIHAWLHRVEGDLPNARYWYGMAGRAEAEGELEEEWEELTVVALAAPSSD